MICPAAGPARTRRGSNGSVGIIPLTSGALLFLLETFAVGSGSLLVPLVAADISRARPCRVMGNRQTRQKLVWMCGCVNLWQCRGVDLPALLSFCMHTLVEYSHQSMHNNNICTYMRYQSTRRVLCMEQISNYCFTSTCSYSTVYEHKYYDVRASQYA